MVHECRHIMPSGNKCKSPALRESAFCYYHVNLRRATGPKGVFDSIELPPLEDSCGLQIALAQVLDAVIHQRIDSKRAGLLLYGLQIAAQLNARRTDAANPVRELCHDDHGNTLAPEEPVCEPGEDFHDSPDTQQHNDRNDSRTKDEHEDGESHQNSPSHKPCHPERSGFRGPIDRS